MEVVWLLSPIDLYDGGKRREARVLSEPAKLGASIDAVSSGLPGEENTTCLARAIGPDLSSIVSNPDYTILLVTTEDSEQADMDKGILTAKINQQRVALGVDNFASSRARDVLAAFRKRWL